MKKALTALMGLFFLLAGCNDQADVRPAIGNDHIRVYPNPVANWAQIEVENRGGSSFLLKVVDPKGDLILEEQRGRVRETFVLNLTGKLKGKYHVVLKTDKSVSVQTLLKL